MRPRATGPAWSLPSGPPERMSAIARAGAWRPAAEGDFAPKPFEAGDLYRIPLWVGERLLSSLGSVSLLVRAVTALGAVQSVVSRGRAQTLHELERHLAPVADERERRRIARRHFEFMRREAFATVWPCIRGFEGADAIAIEGRDHLDDALDAGRGVLLVSAHFGFARLLKPILRFQGYAALLVGRPPGRIRPLTRLGERVRLRILRLPYALERDEQWVRIVGHDLEAGMNIRLHIAALTRNDIVIALADGRAGQSLRPMSVLGVEVPLSPTVFRMARSTGAPILPVFVVDDPSSRDPLGIRLVIEAPLALAPGDPQADLTAFAQLLEARVREQPHLWLRWSGPPPSWWGRIRRVSGIVGRAR